MANVQSIIGKVMSDRAFCEQLIRDPEATLQANGVEPTPEIVDALKGLDPDSVQKLAAAFGKESVAG
jgi:hypothetical protein